MKRKEESTTVLNSNPRGRTGLYPETFVINSTSRYSNWPKEEMLELVFQKPAYGKWRKHERDPMARAQYKEILLDIFMRLAIIKFCFTTQSDHHERHGFGRCS